MVQYDIIAQHHSMALRECGIAARYYMWHYRTALQCGTSVRYCNRVLKYSSVVLQYGTAVRYYDTILQYGTTVLRCGTTVPLCSAVLSSVILYYVLQGTLLI